MKKCKISVYRSNRKKRKKAKTLFMVLFAVSFAVNLFGVNWCQSLASWDGFGYVLGLTLALMAPVILYYKNVPRARVAAHAVLGFPDLSREIAAGKSRLMVAFKETILWTLFSLFPIFFFTGPVLIVNRALDFSQPACHEVRWITRCGPGSDSSVVVESWRPGREEESFDISSSLYRRLERDSVIQVCTKKGRLGIEYITSVRLVR